MSNEPGRKQESHAKQAMQARLQAKADAQVKARAAVKPTAPAKPTQATKTRVASSAPWLKLQAAQLRQVTLGDNGEFLTCTSSKEALDLVTHIKGVFRSRGFGCYALHNYVWIVPFVHTSVHIPDFERAKAVLPDLKGELLAKAFPQETADAKKSEPTVTTKQSAKKVATAVFLFIAAMASLATAVVYRMVNAR